MKKNTQGSVILLVTIVATVTALIAASILALISTQRRLAVRKELQLKSAAAAEAASDYAYSILINKITTSANFDITEIPSSGSKKLSLPTSATSFLSGSVSLPTGAYTGNTGTVSLSEVEVRVGKASASNSRFIDSRDPSTASDPNRGQRVWERTVPIVAKATATQNGVSLTSYVRKRVSVRQVPMFQHAIFFQGQLQLHRSFKIVGPIHTNGMLMLNAQNGDTSIYSGSISAAGEFFRGCTMDVGGTGIDPFGYNPADINGDLIMSSSLNIAATGTNRISVFRETQMSGGTPDHITVFSNPGLDSRSANWKNAALQDFKGNIEDKYHSVPTYTPQGSAGYRQDVPNTPAVNEFSNGTYSLIEPLLPSSHPARKSETNRSNKLAAKAGLILRVERNANFVPAGTPPPGGWTTSNEWRATNRNERFVVKAYKYSGSSTSGSEPTLSPVRLPDSLIGVANSGITAVESGKPHPEPYVVTGSGKGTGNTAQDTANVVTSGLHDARLARGVEPLTLDVARLKRVLEGSDTDSTAAEFRSDFTATGPSADWNGVIYVEMPTSLTPDTSASLNTTRTAGVDIPSRPFSYGAPELRHPDRYSESDNYGRANRTDSIVPIAPELRKYPATNSSHNFTSSVDLKSPEFAIPAIQLINAEKLPNPSGSPGFTLATNGPIYLVGSYNSDGNINTGSNLDSTAPDAYAFADPDEVPSSIFCDTLTLLSKDWAGDRPQSFRGSNNAATSRKADNRIEIAASIATGEYPVFEFFTHALQDFTDLYKTGKPPILIKGSVIGMFKSEIQHIKQAYGRNKNVQIEDYWNDHGSHAIPSVRYHADLAAGKFPPGIPNAFIFRPQDYLLLRPGVAADNAIITEAGFTL